MRKYEITKQGYELFKKDLMENTEENSWIVSELAFFDSFKVKADRETVLQQIIKLNSMYKIRLSRGQSKAPDECGELADFIMSDSFQSRIMTNDKETAIALVNDLGHAAKTRGHFLLSFATKYCHHCNPNMFPIYDSVNAEFLKRHYSYKENLDLSQYFAAFALFCKDIGVDLDTASDRKEGFWVDKFLNNVEKDSD